MAKPLPVLLGSYTLEAGGTERQLTEMAKALDRSKFAPRVGCFRRQGLRVEELEAAGVPVVEFPLQSFYSPSLWRVSRQVQRYCEAEQIQICHAFDLPSGVLFAPSARRAGVRVVLTSQRAYRSMFSWTHQHLIRWTDHLVQGIVVNCEAIRQHLIDDEKVPAQQIHVCYNGLNPERFTPGSRPVHPTPTVGTVSVLRPEKGIDVLIDAAAVAGVSLRIVGSGSEREALEKRAREKRLICEFVPAARAVEEWYRTLDVFVLPSRTEALSNSLMEAMACGCCAIASRVGGSPELIVPGQTGLLFASGDVAGLAAQIRRAVGDAAERQSMAAAGSELIRSEFSTERAVRRLEAIYESFLSR